MRKFVVTLTVLLLAFSGTSHAGIYSQTKLFDNTVVATENTVTSAVIPIGSGSSFSCWVDSSVPTGQSGIANLIIWPEYSYSEDSATFGEVRPFCHVANGLTDVNPVVIPMTSVTAKYMRLKVSGVKGSIFAGNTTGTTVTMYLLKTE